MIRTMLLPLLLLLTACTPAPQDMESMLADLKVKTAELIAAAPSGPLESRLADPALLWRVPGAPETLQDCPECPKMTIVPAGEFTMGSPVGERYRGAEERHRVRIAYPFAVSTFEITFVEWDACVAASGCGGNMPPDEDWGRGRRPVINVSWNDALTYIDWLNAKTGKRYRLLSEAEWEYAARAGTTTAFFYGATLDATQANIDGSGQADSPKSEKNRLQTLPVGSFAPNAFGLYDMHGNVWEFTADCWHDEHIGAPVDGSARTEDGCRGKVVRGGSWYEYSGEARSSHRVGGGSDSPYNTDGFRLARDL